MHEMRAIAIDDLRRLSVRQYVCLLRGYTRLPLCKNGPERIKVLLGVMTREVPMIRWGSRSPHGEKRGIRCNLRQITFFA